MKLNICSFQESEYQRAGGMSQAPELIELEPPEDASPHPGLSLRKCHKPRLRHRLLVLVSLTVMRVMSTLYCCLTSSPHHSSRHT